MSITWRACHKLQHCPTLFYMFGCVQKCCKSLVIRIACRTTHVHCQCTHNVIETPLSHMTPFKSFQFQDYGTVVAHDGPKELAMMRFGAPIAHDGLASPSGDGDGKLGEGPPRGTHSSSTCANPPCLHACTRPFISRFGFKIGRFTYA